MSTYQYTYYLWYYLKGASLESLSPQKSEKQKREQKNKFVDGIDKKYVDQNKRAKKMFFREGKHWYRQLRTTKTLVPPHPPEWDI